VPFIRHARDKRGYETTYVMHGYRPLQGPQRTRVLYLFRSPSHAKVGRQPLDEEIREALEHTHPDVSFDWSALSRESAAMARADEPRDRERDRERYRALRQAPQPKREARRDPQPQPTPQRAPDPVKIELDDQTLLGRALGAERAARLRAEYADLAQRIARRSRTPEDRDRLSERAQRLNPDDWPDSAAVATGLEGFQAEWDAIVAELPARRRGRRGGRRRDRSGADLAPAARSRSDEGDIDPADEASGIMADGGDIDASPDGAQVARPDRVADDHRDDDGGGPEGADQPAGDNLSDDD
jgi:hypothetical protein